MSTLAHDVAPRVSTHPGMARGVVLALMASMAFALSGPMAASLFEAGWTPGMTAWVRATVGALVALPFGIWALGGQWTLLRDHLKTVILYGVAGVAAAQLCYFLAIERMDVGPALLIEYTAPAAVVVWMWLRHQQRPNVDTVVGAAIAAAGLALVLDIGGGSGVSLAGACWALGAMAGAATFFVINGTESPLPPMTLAAGGLTVGSVVLGLMGLVGVLPMRAATADVVIRGAELPWWVPVLVLGVISSAVAYIVGVMAGRALGAQMASFISLFEVVAGVAFAWLLVAQQPAVIQMIGGVLILTGVIVVKVGQGRSANADLAGGQTPRG